MKKLTAMLSAIAIALSLTACGGTAAPAPSPSEKEPSPAPAEILVFAAASMQESLDEAIALYGEQAPEVTVTATYDSSGTLLKQIQEGAPCDLFISAAPKQMDALDGAQTGDAAGESLVVPGSRRDLLENKVVLAVREAGPEVPESFDQLAERLADGQILLAIGNSDVPVGQYTQKIFAYYGIDEASIADKLTYGSNVKEVTTQVAEGIVDCGIIYATDAFSAGLTAVDQASADMCGQVIYPAAVLRCGHQQEAAQAFLDFLSGDGASACFEAVGFTPLG